MNETSCPGCVNPVHVDDPNTVLFEDRIPLHRTCLERLEGSGKARQEHLELLHQGTQGNLAFAHNREG